MAIRQDGNTYYGLSTDTKPTGAVLNGREFREMDTGKKYLFDEENGEWLEQPEEGGGGGGGSSTLSGLTDVDISNPTDGQMLVYNSATGKWENGTGGGTAGILKVHDSGENHGSTLDHTWAEITSAPFVILESVVEIGEGQEIHSNDMYLSSYGYAPPEPDAEPVYMLLFCQWSSTNPTIYTATGPDAYPILRQ